MCVLEIAIWSLTYSVCLLLSRGRAAETITTVATLLLQLTSSSFRMLICSCRRFFLIFVTSANEDVEVLYM